MVAGVELIRKSFIGLEGLPLANTDADLVDYQDIVFAGWDLFGDNLAKAAEEHDVLTHKQFVAVEKLLEESSPGRPQAIGISFEYRRREPPWTSLAP